MGQYFEFINASRGNEVSKIPISVFDIDLPWVAKFDSFEISDMYKIFKQVIVDNKWSEDDSVIAQGDYGDVVLWMDVKPNV